jgi:hypothetical protein
LTRLTRLGLSSLTLGLLALGGTPAAHATECTVDSSSVLETSRLTRFGHEHSCGVDLSKPDEEGERNRRGPQHFNPPHFNSPPIWHRPHDGWHQQYDGKDCNPSVVPLPPSSLLLVSGALALLILGRRRRPATA